MPRKSISLKRAQTRKLLVGAAREAIGTQGFHRATLDDIAARVGLTKGAIYDHFDSKDDLFLEVVSSSSRERLTGFPWPENRSGSLKTRLRRLARAVITEAPEWKIEAPLRAEFLLYSLTHEGVREHLSSLYGQRAEFVCEQLRKSIADEELPIPMASFAALLEALIPGLMYVRAQAPEHMTDERIIQIFESLA